MPRHRQALLGKYWIENVANHPKEGKKALKLLGGKSVFTFGLEFKIV